MPEQAMAGCAFCEVIQGTKSAHVVFEDDVSLAFLDIRPVFQGHCLLVPKNHYETLMDLPTDLGCRLFANTQLLARAVETGMHADGIFVANNNRVSQSVPHVHIHVVPRRIKDGLKGFFWPRTKYPDEDAAAQARETIVTAVEELQSASTKPRA